MAVFLGFLATVLLVTVLAFNPDIFVYAKIQNTSHNCRSYYKVKLDGWERQAPKEVEICENDKQVKECGVPPKVVHATSLACFDGKWRGVFLEWAPTGK